VNQMSGLWEVMALPFAECLVLVGIHSYLGLHVLRRQVIFVDLALAQIAALGTTVAFMFHIDPLSKGAYVFSLLATILAAALFSLTRFRRERIPQEAVIGLIYALAAAVGILIIARAPHGAEHIQKILTGQLLWVKADEVIAAAVVYSVVGLFHYVFRHKFLAISEDPERARADGINVRLWDFLFYMSFGLVITHSVRTAGVLLVFVFLVVPAIMAMMITTRLAAQLLIGWGAGFAVSISGLVLSWHADTATGPTVVSLYGAVLLVVALLLLLVRAGPAWKRIAGRMVLGAAIISVIFVGFIGLGRLMGSVPYWARTNGEVRTHAHASHSHGTTDEATAGEVCVGDCPLHRYLHSLEPLDIEARAEKLATRTDPLFVAELLEHLDPNDEEMRLVVARRLLQLDPAAGKPALVELMSNGKTPLFRSEALDALVPMAGDDFGFDPWTDPETTSNRAALRRWRD